MTSIANLHPIINNTSTTIDIHSSNLYKQDSSNMQPPRPPSQRPPVVKPSVTRAQQHTPKLQRQAFRQKISSANKTAICTTTSQRVGRRTLRELLHTSEKEAYSVPIFQRRYCWNTTQWDTLWYDILKRKSLKHSLGRLTCTNATRGRSIIIDGQQRFTSTTLVLAAIRDAIVSLDQNNSSLESQSLVQSIHEMLFLDPRAMEQWVANDKSSIAEGQELEFCRLIPTFCDRSSYLAAILPSSASQVQTFLKECYNPKWHRPLLAKKHFENNIAALLLKSSSSRSPFATLKYLTSQLLDGLDILYFPIDVDHGFRDGTEDTQVIYERLAIRDATWCKPRRTSEYHSMDGTDMIRNLVLGSFQGKVSKTAFYETYWLPLERMFQTRLDEEESLNAFFVAFLDATAPLSAESTNGGVIGGRIYKDFEIWMAGDFERWQQQQKLSNGLVLAEEHTMDVGKRLLEFAQHRK